jgi:nucleoside-diphosphate-sugar epimerase
MIKVVITGANGFVGRHLLADIDASRFDITVITRSPEKKTGMFPTQVKVVKADLNDEQSLINALAGADLLINTAAEVRNASRLAETNIEGTKKLVKAILKNKVPRVIHLSSVGVVGMQYSTTPVIVNEETVCDPKNEYERTKLESEVILKDASREGEFSLAVLRPTNVFGESHPFNALLKLMQHVTSEKAFIQSRDAVFNYVYVKDLTASIIFMVNSPGVSGTFNIGEALPAKEFVRILNELLVKKQKTIIIPWFVVKAANIAGIKIINSVSNRVEYSDAALKRFFSYPFGIKEGLERTITDFKKKGLLS